MLASAPPINIKNQTPFAKIVTVDASHVTALLQATVLAAIQLLLIPFMWQHPRVANLAIRIARLVLVSIQINAQAVQVEPP